ncbi:MAG: VOC family protein [Gammaproteobacteria bacterium]|nr:VOC family protein [Gammaproteobacteria bacterium]
MQLLDAIPMLETDDVEGTADFYVEKLGFKQHGRFPETGAMTWASLKRDRAQIMFSVREGGARRAPVWTGAIYCHARDLERLWEELRDSVEVEQELKANAHGTPEFTIRDCNGYRLRFGESE